MKRIDLETYARKEHFNYFRSLGYPYLGCTVNVDVGKMLEICKEKKISFYLSFIHVVALAADSIEQLRQRIVDNGINEYEHCPTSHVELLDNNTYVYCTLYHDMSLKDYLLDAANRQQKARQHATFEEEEGVESMYFISTLPWINYTQLIQPVGCGDDSNPRITWGKYEKDWQGKMMMPVSLVAHHGLVDGIQLGQFYQQLDIQIEQFIMEANSL